ncbi:MAG: class I SAM-dependent methyltransferase [Planctomycetes bacterium]|nr:class I SAM-dependent methyltransferase [Planctomycetota bacterium]
MDHREVGKYWDANAAAWTELARLGYDVYRDCLNTPEFLEMLPDVTGLMGVDIGCGEGHNTRRIAEFGADMAAFDISRTFVELAAAAPSPMPADIVYCRASAVEMPFGSSTFDFAVATMSLMDIPEVDRVFMEIHRVLKPGGFLQFSITHPCFGTPRWRWVADDSGTRIGVICGDYFEHREHIDEWLFGAAPRELKEKFPLFRVPRFYHTLSEWVAFILNAGLVIEEVREPSADDDTAARCPDVADTRIIPLFLHARCRKPG